MERTDEPQRRRTVATRVLASYLIVTLAFSVVAGWAVVVLRAAADEAVQMRSVYMPLAVSLRDAVASQDIWNTQLNHVTTAKNPADKRVWFDVAMRGGRPKMFAELRAAISRAFDPEDAHAQAELFAEVSSIERLLEGDREPVARLFDALDARDEKRAEAAREALVRRGHQGKKRLSGLEQRIGRLVDASINQARARERWGLGLLVGLASFTVLVGLAMALYARRVLAPLEQVTERAKAVARGDLTPHAVVGTRDEIGELAQTFEGMVAAIAKANDDLLAHERLATIGKMAAHVTHEIRNPLSSLALNVELLEEELDPTDDEAIALHRAIKNEVDRLTALSERYLSVARRKPPNLEEEDLPELVREAIDFVRKDLERHGVEVVLDAEEDVPAVRVDEGQVKQVVHNLVRNAREAMPSGGRVTVSVGRDGSRGVMMVVDDDGQGIEPEQREKLFEPFFTTKGHGTGLGLVITREVVEAHGGSIECLGREPRGTRFVVRLPIALEPESPAVESTDAASGALAVPRHESS